MRAVDRRRLAVLLAGCRSESCQCAELRPVRQLTIRDMKRLACQNACSSDYSTDTGRPTLSEFAVYTVHSGVKI